MDFDDFGTWMKDTVATFPSLRKWMGTQPENGKALWKQWRQALDGVTLDAAAKAVEKMVENVKLQPFGDRWDQMPGIVIGLAGSSSTRPKGDRKCICGGDGIVEVGVTYQAKTFDGAELPVIWIDGQQCCGPIGAACLCLVGEWVNGCRQRHAKDGGPKLLPVYDPKKMVLFRAKDHLFAPKMAEEEKRNMAHSMSAFDLDLPTFGEETRGEF